MSEEKRTQTKVSDPQTLTMVISLYLLMIV